VAGRPVLYQIAAMSSDACPVAYARSPGSDIRCAGALCDRPADAASRDAAVLVRAEGSGLAA
jgi:hypothetical protein